MGKTHPLLFIFVTTVWGLQLRHKLTAGGFSWDAGVGGSAIPKFLSSPLQFILFNKISLNFKE